MGEGCNPTVIPILRTAVMLCEDDLYTETVIVQPPSQTDTGRPVFHRPLPPPPPKPLSQTDRQTNERSELIYMIVCNENYTWQITQGYLNSSICLSRQMVFFPQHLLFWQKTTDLSRACEKGLFWVMQLCHYKVEIYMKPYLQIEISGWSRENNIQVESTPIQS